MSDPSIIKVHSNFVRDVKEIYKNELKRDLPPQAVALLNKPLNEMLASLKLLINVSKSSIQDIQTFVLNDLNIKQSDLKEETVTKLKRYSEYFYETASLF